MMIEIDSVWMYYLAVTLLLAVIASSLLKLAPGPKNEQVKSFDRDQSFGLGYYFLLLLKLS